MLNQTARKLNNTFHKVENKLCVKYSENPRANSKKTDKIITY